MAFCLRKPALTTNDMPSCTLPKKNWYPTGDPGTGVRDRRIRRPWRAMPTLFLISVQELESPVLIF